METLKRYVAHIVGIALLVGIVGTNYLTEQFSVPNVAAASESASYTFTNAEDYDADSTVSINSGEASLNAVSFGNAFELTGFSGSVGGLRHHLSAMGTSRIAAGLGGALEVDANNTITQTVSGGVFGQWNPQTEGIDDTYAIAIYEVRQTSFSPDRNNIYTAVYKTDGANLESGGSRDIDNGFYNCSFISCSVIDHLRTTAVVDSTHFLSAYNYSGPLYLRFQSINYDLVNHFNTTTTITDTSNSVGTSGTYPDIGILQSDATDVDFVITYLEGTSLMGAIGHIDIDDTVNGSGFNSSTFTFGTPVALATSVMSTQEFGAEVLDSGKVLLFWEDTSDVSHAQVAEVTIDAGTPANSTISTSGTSATQVSGNSQFMDLTAIDATTFAAAYYDDDSDDRGEIALGSVSGTTVSISGTSEFNSGRTTGITVDSMGNGRVVLGYYDDETTDKSYAKVGTVAPASIKGKVQPKWGIVERGITSWDSFTETATKPANTEINYQISIDDGTSWLYWNGSSWATDPDPNEGDTETEYNSASVVNTNLSSLPITSAELTFRAFLVSNNGTSLPSLDKVDIGYSAEKEIRFTDSTYTTEYNNFNPSDTLYIEVRDASAQGDGTKSVAVTNTNNSDTETITVTETGGSTGIFRGSLGSQASGANSGNGTIEGAALNIISASVVLDSLGIGVIDNFNSYANTADAIDDAIGVPEDQEYIEFYGTHTLVDNAGDKYLSGANTGNPERGTWMYGSPVRGTGGTYNFKDSSLKIDLRLNDTSLLNSTGYSFISLDLHDVTIGVENRKSSLTFPTVYLTASQFTNNQWGTFILQQSDFSESSYDWGAIYRVNVAGVTGNGSSGSSGLVIDIDNIEMGDPTYTDTTAAPNGILFTDSSYSTKSSFEVGETVYVEMTNIPRAGTGSQSVTFTSTNGDTETITLTEVGSSGIFQGSILSDNATVSTGNSILNLTAGATVTADGGGLYGGLIGDFDSLTTAGLGIGSWTVSDPGGNTNPPTIISEFSPSRTGQIGSAAGQTKYLEIDVTGTDSTGAYIIYFPSSTNKIDMTTGLNLDVYVDSNSNLSGPDPANGSFASFKNFNIIAVNTLSGSTTAAAAIEIPAASFTSGDWTSFSYNTGDFITFLGTMDWSEVVLAFLAINSDGTTSNDLLLGIDNVGTPAAALPSASITAASGPLPVVSAGLYITNSSYVSLDDLTTTTVDPGDTLYFRLNEAASAGDGTKNVQVSTGSDTETITLTEVGSSGTFQGSLSSSSSSSATSGNSNLELGGGETITAQVVTGGLSEVTLQNFESYADAAAMNAIFTNQDPFSTSATLETDRTQYWQRIALGADPVGIANVMAFTTPTDLTARALEFELYVDDPNKLDPTGNDFQGSAAEDVTDIEMLFIDGGAAANFTILRSSLSAGWNTITINTGDWGAWGALPLLDMSSRQAFIFAAITGSNTANLTGSDLTVAVDNFKHPATAGSFGSSDTATVTGTNTGGSSSGGTTTTTTTTTDPVTGETTTTTIPLCTIANNVTDLTAQVISEQQGDLVQLNWNLPDTLLPTNYIIKRGGKFTTNPANMSVVTTLTNGTTLYEDTTVNSGVIYNYAVVAENSCGDETSNAPTTQIQTPQRIPEGADFDLTININVKTSEASDQEIVDELKELLEDAQQESSTRRVEYSMIKGEELIAQSGFLDFLAPPVSSQGGTTASFDPLSCAGATEWVKENESRSFVGNIPFLVEQFYRMHAEAIIHREFFCNVASGIEFDLNVFFDSMFFLRESIVREWHSRKLVAFSPNYSALNIAAKDVLRQKVNELVSKSVEVVEAQKEIIFKLEQEGLHSINTATFEDFEDVVAQEDLKSTLLELPEIENLIEGHKETFTLQIWSKDDRTSPVYEETITTNIFGEAIVTIKDFVSAEYDFTIKKPNALRKALKGINANRAELNLDFTRGLGSARDAYLKIGDFNDDGSIDARDFEAMAEVIRGENESIDVEEVDLSGDGELDLEDFVEIIQNWGTDE